MRLPTFYYPYPVIATLVWLFWFVPEQCLLALQSKSIYHFHASMSTWNPRNKLAGDMQYSEGSMWNLPKTFPGTFLRTFPQFAPNLLVTLLLFFPGTSPEPSMQPSREPGTFQWLRPPSILLFWQRPAQYPWPKGPIAVWKFSGHWQLAFSHVEALHRSLLGSIAIHQTTTGIRDSEASTYQVSSSGSLTANIHQYYITWYSPSTIGTIDRQMPWIWSLAK